MFLKEYGTIEQTGYVIESDSTALEMYENAAVLYYTMCAEHGNIPAMLALARIYKEGIGSIEKDEQKSTRYFFMSGIGRNWYQLSV